MNSLDEAAAELGFETLTEGTNPSDEPEEGLSHRAKPEEGVNPKDAIGARKLPTHLVPPIAIAHEALAFADGASKYGPYNWREKKVRASVYYAAALRHLMAWFEGERCASDSGAHHLAHARACMAILLDAEEGGCLADDRPSPTLAWPEVVEDLSRQLQRILDR